MFTNAHLYFVYLCVSFLLSPHTILPFVLYTQHHISVGVPLGLFEFSMFIVGLFLYLLLLSSSV